MASNDRSVMLSVLAGIGIGVLVGSISGLLMAPKSGEETRDDLSKTISELTDKVNDLGKTVGQKVTAASERIRAQMAQKLGDSVDEEATS